jgi:quercetin dioxygenase-like cupin family protein/DNA-binding transcriptional regulator YiaG
VNSKKETAYEDLLDRHEQMDRSTGLEDFLDDVSAHSTEGPEIDAAERVGERVKAIREQRGLSLEDLASRTGYPIDLLREVENEMVSPPLGVLVKLSKALEMKMGHLLTSGPVLPYCVVRKEDRRPLSRFASKDGKRYGYFYESLAPGKKDRQMEPFLVTLEPADEQKEVPSTHDGQEFIFVLDGDMHVTLGEEEFVLHPGDSIYYDSTVPHLVKCGGGKPTRILAVLSTESN